MDYFLNPETWKQQWAIIANAPFFVIPLILIVALVVGWFQGRLSAAQIAGLKEQISAVEQRLKLADDASSASDRAKDELEKLKKEFQDYKEQVAINGNNASSAKVDAAIVRVTSGNAEIRKKLFDALMSRETDSRTPVINIDGDPKIR
jgi:hypothetical protein